MKKIVFFAVWALIALNVFAQRNLMYENRTNQDDVYGGEANEACVTFSTPQNIRPLFFESYNQKQPANIDTTGNDVNYHLVFDARAGKNSRKIDIRVDGFTPVRMEWYLSPKQQLNYYLYDPDSTIVNCYNQLTREGLVLFKSGMYEDAKAKYESARTCYNIPKENDIDERIALIDSIIIWKNIGDIALEKSDYSSAISDYQKIYVKNPEDNYVKDRLWEARSTFNNFCTQTFKIAEAYFEEKDYKNAQLLYEKTILQLCPNASLQAHQRLQEIRTLQQLPQMLTYEYAVNTPIGLSTGGYKDNKTSGYFTIRFNSQVFEAFRNNLKDDDKPELNVSFGWTIKIVKPVWIFFGPGYTAVGKNIYEDDDIERKNPKLDIYHAVSPEAGVVCKIKLGRHIGVALRYTYQYRFALKKEMEDYIGAARHVLGAGLCF